MSIPQVYRNTRSRRKRPAPVQLPSNLIFQTLSYLPDECKEITTNGERCGVAFKFRNQLNNQLMNCQHYCLENLESWLPSLLEDLREKSYISFHISGVNRIYAGDSSEILATIIPPIRVTYVLSDSTLFFNVDAFIESSVENMQGLVNGYHGRLQQISLTIPVEIFSSEDVQTLSELNFVSGWVDVEVDDTLIQSSILKAAQWKGQYPGFYPDRFFYLTATLNL